MSYQDIRFEVEDGVGLITLHRPEHMNTFSGLMGEELGRAYRECDENDAVRAVVLTGAGSAFCAGADMAMGEQTFAPQAEEGFSATPVSIHAWEVRKPVIAALNGHAIGIGLTLALQCDIRIAAKEGKYGILQVRRGMMPDCGAHWTLPRLVGFARAADLLLTGRKFQGDEAVELGIATRALAGAQVLGCAMEIARDIAQNTAPLSVGVTKKLLWQSAELTAEQVERFETLLHHHLMAMPDAVEGVMAFLERREPAWSASVSRDWPEWPAPEDEER